MKLSRPVSFVAVTLLCLAPLAADAKLENASATQAKFTAKGPAGLKIEGTTSDLRVGDDGSNVIVTVSLGNIDTGMSLRNNHTKKALEVDRFPTAELSVPRASLQFPDNGRVEGDASGTMRLHGTSRSMGFHYKARKDGGAIVVSATANINFNDYGVQAPSYMGVTVKPDIVLSVDFHANDD